VRHCQPVASLLLMGALTSPAVAAARQSTPPQTPVVRESASDVGDAEYYRMTARDVRVSLGLRF
jgi:hypothetical protein